ncbi:ABC transporter permease protein [Mycoplasmopsis californica HAZ160_1]|uniref:ABC transporter permease protein n=1 Tax=Mycoplasmopsis californica HAZ160_1 TaxID=1397850 RepID=A0AAT9F8J1_9BACT|nr:YitT family protein [Mycoplasmopsis californica]BAP01214.1 ABC transporter permease protein [Mycoplasmopsis californica HAZ160_1]BBG41085.1 ABC transporter permease protein [Mycoplasmopsis californica]BBG41678.1 ABC transporter permease protein [Mycoplasmopsis californica]BBG42272.1 ABC transporter permease protein [Mycoplasmopsis californica]BBG42849.1 ABC transporter permease protein [Mycoplasmopsis californica]
MNTHASNADSNTQISKDIKDYKMGAHGYKRHKNNNKELKGFKAQRYFIKTFYMFLAAFLFNFGLVVFLRKSETIPSGLSGIPMLISLVHKETAPYFALMYLAFNIPLFAIFGWRIKRSFSLHTLEFMIFQIIIQFFLTFEFVKGASAAGWFEKYFNIAPGWEREITINGNLYENPVTWPILANGLIGSVFVGASIAVAWKFGGSTGGTDIIGFYFSTRRKKSIGVVLSTIAIFTSIVFLLIFAFMKPHANSVKVINDVAEGKNIQYFQTTNEHVFFGMREVTSFVYIGVVNGLVSLLYPKYKKVTMEIACAENFDIVLQYFRDIHYWHAYSIQEHTSGYTGKKVYKLTTTLLVLECKNIIKDLRNLHPRVWISIKPVKLTIGHFDTRYVDED